MLSKFATNDLLLRAIFIENGIPDELRYIAFYSFLEDERANKKGPFFLSANEAKLNGLEVSKYIDERYDIIKAAHVFCNVIAEKHKSTQNWGGALINFISEENTISDKTNLNEYTKEIGKLPYGTASFYSGYVSSVYLVKKGKELGLNSQPDTSKYERAEISTYTTLYQLSSQLGVSYEKLKELNPTYILNIIPNDGRDHFVTLPKSAAERFDKLGDEVYSYVKTPTFTRTEMKIMEVEVPDTSAVSATNVMFDEDLGKDEVYYSIRNGDILLKVADLFDCEVVEIVRWNNISKDKIDINQRLVIKVDPEKRAFYQSIDQMTNAQRAAVIKRD